MIAVRIDAVVLVAGWKYSARFDSLPAMNVGATSGRLSGIDASRAAIAEDMVWSPHFHPTWLGSMAGQGSAAVAARFDAASTPIAGGRVMTTETDIQGAPADDRIDAAHGYVRAFARAPSASRGFRERTGASSLVSVGADGRAPYLHRHNLAHALAGFTAAEAPPVLAGAQTSGRADKAHRGMDRVDLDEAEDAHGGLVIAGGDAAKPLEHACHALDAVALGVSNPTQRARLLAAGFSRDDRMRALKARLSPQLIAGQPLSASSSCGCCPTATNRVGVEEISAVRPGVRCTAIGTPCACVSTWILVLKPMPDWPKAFERPILSWLRRCAGAFG
jgi:hypothetical protein